MPVSPEIVDTDAASPDDRNPAGSDMTGGLEDEDLGDAPAGESGPIGTGAGHTGPADDSTGETDPTAGIEDPPTGDDEPVEGVPALADADAPVEGDTNPLTAKDAELRTAATGAGSKAERPVEQPGVDKADVVQRRAKRAADTELRDRQAAEVAARGTGPGARDTSTEDEEASRFASDRPDRRGPVDVTYDGPERRRTVDSTQGAAVGRPVAHRAGAHGDLVLDTHGRPFIAGSTHTATYVYDDVTDVAPGAGRTGLVLELDTPRGRRLIPAVRTGAPGAVSVTFPVEFEGPYSLRLLDGSRVVAKTSFRV
jgi:hypothetical protein